MPAYDISLGYEQTKLRPAFGVNLLTDVVNTTNVLADCTGLQFPLVANVDHNHDTGKVRGLLCSKCNASLGHIEKPGFLTAAKEYLERT